MERLIRQLRLRLRSLFQRKRVERELDEELEYHLDRQTEERVAGGLSAEDARYAALRELGAVTQSKEECRDMRRWRPLEDLARDLRHGVRALGKHPGFSIVAVAALALGIGANTAMFSIAYGILLRPLPYAGADRLAVVYMRYFPRDFAFGTMSIRDYLLWKENNRAFENPALFRSLVLDVAGKEGALVQVAGASVTAGFFGTLGAQPLMGRGFSPGEDEPNSRPLAVIGETIWRERFGASAEVLGEAILVNGAPATVIGVMRRDFGFPRRDTQVWTNLPLNPPTRFGPWFYRGVARLKPGVTLEQAQAETNAIALRMMRENPYYKRLTLPVVGLRDALLGTTLKPAILLLAGAVGLVLLIAVVNVANLALARATAREREMAVRLSLGAGRGRLLRQLVTESVILAAAGGVAGLGLAWGAIALIRAWNPGNLPLIDSVRLDAGALVFMLAVSILTGVVFGLAPALQSVRADLNRVIKENGRGTGQSRAQGRARAVLVVTEIAVSLMLLVGAGLLIRNFANLQRVNAGFSVPPRRIFSLLISPDKQRYGNASQGLAFYAEVLRRVGSIPGVESAALTDSLPPDRQGDADTFALEGQALAPDEINPIVSDVTAGPRLFETLGIPLSKGRFFDSHDDANSLPVAIVSEGFVQRFLGNREPIGKRIKQSGPGSENKWLEIVGVVGNVKYLGLTADTDPAYYIPFAQSYSRQMYLAVRTSGDAGQAAGAVRRQIQAIDPGVTLAEARTMEQALALSVSQPRFDTMLLGLFAGMALVLASIGIYGLLAYSVAQRTHEIGVRMALGAAKGDVVRMVVGQSATLAAIGIAIGLAGGLALTRLLKALLFGVSVTDALTFATAPLALMLVVCVATLVPALRATRISPVTALRNE